MMKAIEPRMTGGMFLLSRGVPMTEIRLLIKFYRRGIGMNGFVTRQNREYDSSRKIIYRHYESRKDFVAKDEDVSPENRAIKEEAYRDSEKLKRSEVEGTLEMSYWYGTKTHQEIIDI